MSTASLQKLMKEFFATHSYNREDDWRETPETDADPVDDGDVVRLKDWDPAQHPRVPAGSGDPSGEFTSGDGGTGVEAEDVRTALDTYVRLAHDQINDYMRGNRSSVGRGRVDAKKHAEALKAAFNDPKLCMTVDYDRSVYRGIDSAEVYRAVVKMKSGDEIVDKAFLSTSRSSAVAESAASWGYGDKSVVVNIDVGKGTRYLPGNSREQEMLFKGSTRLRVLSVKTERHASGRRATVRAVMLP